MKITDSRHRISELIEYLNISKTEFCNKTGIMKSALSNYLNGDREPRQPQIAKIADAFDIDPAWVMGYDVPMKREQVQSFSTAEEFEKHWNAIGGGRHPLELSDLEHTLVVNFRASDPVTQSNVMKLLDIPEKKDINLDA